MLLKALLNAGRITDADVVEWLGQLGIHTAEHTLLLISDGDYPHDKGAPPRERFDVLYQQLLTVCAAPPITGTALLDHLVHFHRVISTACKGLDRLLGGGVGSGQITEFVGKTSTFKTQVCHQIALSATQEGAAVLYIDTTNSFSPRRLADMLFRLQPALEAQRHAPCLPPALATLLTNVRCVAVYDTEALLPVLASVEAQLQRYQGPESGKDVATEPGTGAGASRSAETEDVEQAFWGQLRVLIIDSLGSLFVPVLGRSSAGHALLMAAVQALRGLATRYDLSVVTTNFVVQGDRDASGTPTLRPALGATWAYVPSWSVMLTVDQAQSHNTTQPRALRVTAQLIKAPSSPFGCSETCTLLG